MSKQLDLVNGLKRATEGGKVAWRTLAEPGLAGVGRYLGTLPKGKSFLLQGSSVISPFGESVVLEIRDEDGNVAYTIQTPSLTDADGLQLKDALRALWGLVVNRGDTVLNEALEELGVKTPS